MSHPHLPSTQAAVNAVRALAQEFGLEIVVTDDIGADQTSRRTSAGAFSVLDEDGSLPHEAFIELGGSPSVSVQLYPEDDARIVVDGVEFADVPRDAVPGFVRALHTGLAHVKGRFFPPGQWLIVPVPGGRTYKELVPMTALTPWLSSRVR
ncbi:hypothetical protein HHL19_32850 [Streptomyces sp. R302]|uniref:hypothetical protein n=1 Tax=unclassified Streptomyces TaxID=2593676 RepID=UPI00145D5A79|nr:MULTISPECIES: hypothetical protein [unclassified Streptomyces]NML54043.1 hypothetical protein [Streptomyces sp. R301]NML83303.1 hypothetical protein [Streptomyces sp. R302]